MPRTKTSEMKEQLIQSWEEKIGTGLTENVKRKSDLRVNQVGAVDQEDKTYFPIKGVSFHGNLQPPFHREHPFFSTDLQSEAFASPTHLWQLHHFAATHQIIYWLRMKKHQVKARQWPPKMPGHQLMGRPVDGKACGVPCPVNPMLLMAPRF